MKRLLLRIVILRNTRTMMIWNLAIMSVTSI
jgi:hypothetical protein